MAVHDRLKEERSRLLFSQADFAERAGVSRNTQVRYESGKTAPSSAYLGTIEALGVDVGYVLFGAAVGEVVCTYLESQGIDRKISLEECRRHATNPLMGGTPRWFHCCQDCPKNPVTHRIIPQAPADIDGALLASVLEHVDVALGKAGKKASAMKKAQAVVMLYRASKASGQIDPKMVDEVVLLAAD
jgi:transcriptional regulator with XRE-family HTH domain